MITNIFNKDFWNKALGRALRSFCQGFITAGGSAAVGITDMDIFMMVNMGLGMALVSICTSVILGIPEADNPEK